MKKIYKYEVCMMYEHQMRQWYNYEGIAQHSYFMSLRFRNFCINSFTYFRWRKYGYFDASFESNVKVCDKTACLGCNLIIYHSILLYLIHMTTMKRLCVVALFTRHVTSRVNATLSFPYLAVYNIKDVLRQKWNIMASMLYIHMSF